MELSVFKETKLTKRIYTRESSGYGVVATEAPSAHSKGVSVFYRATKHYFVEVLQTYGENFVIFHMALGNRKWFIVG